MKGKVDFKLIKLRQDNILILGLGEKGVLKGNLKYKIK